MKASASATASSAMSSARACCCIWSTAQEENAGKAYKTIRGELAAYGDGLAEKPEIVALNKIDALDAGRAQEEGRGAEARRRPRRRCCSRRSRGEGVEADAARADRRASRSQRWPTRRRRLPIARRTLRQRRSSRQSDDAMP